VEQDFAALIFIPQVEEYVFIANSTEFKGYLIMWRG